MFDITNTLSCFEILNEDFAVNILRKFGLAKDYSERSLIELENWMASQYSKTNPPFVTSQIVFGHFLGECIIRNIPEAKWDLSDATTIFDARVRFPAKNHYYHVKPFERVREYAKDQNSNLSSLYRTVNLLNLGFVEVDNVKSGNSIHLPSGLKLTIIEK